MACNGKAEAARGLVEQFSDYIREARIVGVGTGSTTALALREAARRGLLDGKVLVASSISTALMLADLGFKPVMPHVVSGIDFYFDGADEVVPGELYLLKGRGGALLGEKILAHSSTMRVYVVDDSKIVPRLGSGRALPLEVTPWALAHVLSELGRLGYSAAPRVSGGKDSPVTSDWGGIVVDVETGPIEDPPALDCKLKSIPGVVETGIFAGLADAVVVGSAKCGYEVVWRGKGGR